MKKERGFKKLVGKTISAVKADSINEVLLVDEDGYHYAIRADELHLGIPIITLEKLSLKKSSKKTEKPVVAKKEQS